MPVELPELPADTRDRRAFAATEKRDPDFYKGLKVWYQLDRSELNNGNNEPCFKGVREKKSDGKFID